MAKSDLFHWFFHGGPREEYANCNYSYHGDSFYSYATTIGVKMVDDNGENWLAISAYSMSNTTCNHISKLRAACPYDNFLAVPINVGDRLYDEKDVAYNFLEWARNQKDRSFAKGENRHDFIRIHDAFKTFELKFVKAWTQMDAWRVASAELDMIRKAVDEKEQRLKESKERLLNRTDEEIEAARAKREAAAERKRVRDEAKVAEIMGMPYLERVRLLFDIRAINERPYHISKDAWALAQQKMQESDETRAYSFMWPEGDGVRTSQRVYVPSDDVKKAITLYVKTRKVLGTVIGGFTLVGINEKAVRVGCHLIPMENVKAMAEAFGIAWI